MIDLTKEFEIKQLKEAFDYSFKGPLGGKTMQFLEEFCGFYSGGFRDDLNRLEYEAGKRDVILTIKTISNPEWEPHQIAETYKRLEN